MEQRTQKDFELWKYMMISAINAVQRYKYIFFPTRLLVILEYRYKGLICILGQLGGFF